MLPVARPAMTWLKNSSGSCQGGAAAKKVAGSETVADTWLKPSIGSTSVSQVGASHRLVVPQLRGVRGQDDAAGLQHVAVLGYAQGHRRVLLHQEDGQPFLPVDSLDDVEDLLHHSWCQAQGGLGQEEERGPGHEPPAYGHHLILAPS